MSTSMLLDLAFARSQFPGLSGDEDWLPGARRVVHVRPATDGAFTVDGLPSGDYAIAAAENLDPADLAVPVFLEQLLAASHRITLADAERKVQDLRVK